VDLATSFGFDELVGRAFNRKERKDRARNAKTGAGTLDRKSRKIRAKAQNKGFCISSWTRFDSGLMLREWLGALDLLTNRVFDGLYGLAESELRGSIASHVRAASQPQR
jgi:hypothetical protein